MAYTEHTDTVQAPARHLECSIIFFGNNTYSKYIDYNFNKANDRVKWIIGEARNTNLIVSPLWKKDKHEHFRLLAHTNQSLNSIPNDG